MPAGNGVAALPPAEILSRSKAALKQAKSFRISGNMVNNGQRVNLDLKTRGADVGGSMAFGKAKVELLTIKGRQYIRPNQQFWAMAGDPAKAPAVAKLIGDRWVKVPADKKEFAELFNAADIDSLLEPDAKLTKGAEKTIDGIETIALVDSGADGGTLYVATEGEPYPIQMVPTKASDGQLTFSAFGNAFPELKAPAQAQVLDMQALG